MPSPLKLSPLLIASQPDNGVKIIDSDGGMLAMAWERYAVSLANAADNGLAAAAAEVAAAVSVDPAAWPAGGPTPLVFVGYDNRPSSPALAELLVKGVLAAGGKAVSYGTYLCGVIQINQCSPFPSHSMPPTLPSLFIFAGVLTTPTLHWLVGSYNASLSASGATPVTPALPTVDAYFTTLATSFAACVSRCPRFTHDPASADAALHLDCAHGVGYPALARLTAAVAATGPTAAAVFAPKLYNGGEATGADVGVELNNGCGADHVQKTRAFPRGLEAPAAAAVAAAAKGVSLRFASLDGDADRLVYYLSDARGALVLIDGDRLSAMLCVFLQRLLAATGLAQSLRLGVVQTAYANSASTRFIEALGGVECAVACTGVKHLHHVALQFDIGVYFEANGHGTVLFSPKAQAAFTAAAAAAAAEGDAALPEARAAAEILAQLPLLVNPYIGDAASDLLLLELVQRFLPLTLPEAAFMYSDLATRMDKVVVPDRRVVTTADFERKCVTPAGLQEAIDAAVKDVPSGRSFVRPSGTEDIVRVFAEAETQEQADELCKTVQKLVQQFC